MMNILDRKFILYLVCLFNLFMVNGIFGATNQLDKSRKSANDNVNLKTASGGHVIYIYPPPGANYVTSASNIIIRSNNFIDPSTINDNDLFDVVGSLSGKHEGKIVLSDDRKTLLFQPDFPFANGENVTVVLREGLKTIANEDITIHPISFSISMGNLNLNKKNIRNSEFSDLDNLPAQLESKTSAAGQTGFTSLSRQSPHKISAIKIDSENLPPDIPYLTVNQSINPSSSGYLFLSTIEGLASRNLGNYNMIVDNSGNPAYYNKVGIQWGIDFKIQPNGTLSYFDFNTDQYYILNTAFRIIDSVQCGNGYITDDHELRVYPDGNMFILGDDYETVNMSQIVPGGSQDPTVEGSILQELDKNKNVIFQWRSWDHYKITDATHENLTAPNIDYVHANAIEIDTDGNILLSARHLDEITKINSQTGNIIWRWGGINNQFTFVNDTLRFSHQHAIRFLPNHNIIFFDNGNFHTPPFSRAVEYKIDEINKTADLVWQFRNNPDIFGSALGYVQRYGNGNTLICWGQADTTLSEVTPERNR